MASISEQLLEARGEVARLTGVESQYNTLVSQLPGGVAGVASLTEALASIPGGVSGIPGLISERNSFQADVQRLQGELTTSQGEATRFKSELDTLQGSFDERVELRAAELNSSLGNQPPAKADTTGATTSADGKTASTRSYAEHWSHYSTLSAEDKNAYYKANSVAMNATR